jgi:hypothetical protein
MDSDGEGHEEGDDEDVSQHIAPTQVSDPQSSHNHARGCAGPS